MARRKSCRCKSTRTGKRVKCSSKFARKVCTRKRSRKSRRR